jgi:hypothetical protein
MHCRKADALLRLLRGRGNHDYSSMHFLLSPDRQPKALRLDVGNVLIEDKRLPTAEGEQDARNQGL